MVRWAIAAILAGTMTALAYAQAPAGEKAADAKAPAAAATAPETGKTEAKPPVKLGYVPRRPFDVLPRFFDLKPEQKTAMAALQRQWAADRREVIAELEHRLDAKYLDQVAASLDEKDRAQFKKVYEAVQAYYASIDAAEQDLRDAWTHITGEETVWVAARTRMQIFNVLPGVDPKERGRINNVVFHDYYKDLSARVKAELDAAGIKAPANHKDAAAMRTYSQQYMEIHKKVSAELEPHLLSKARDMLTPEQRKTFDELGDALDANDGKKNAAEETLAAKLVELVAPDRLQGQGPVQMQFMGRGPG